MEHLYRPGVGICLVNRDKKIFLGKRIQKFDVEKSDLLWQMPQGGIDPGEQPIDAFWRELKEEIGLSATHVRIMAESDWLYYDLPKEWHPKLWKGQYHGQRQIWFLAAFTGNDADIDLEAFDEPEFSEWQWQSFEFACAHVIPFKRTLYCDIKDTFKNIILNQIEDT